VRRDSGGFRSHTAGVANMLRTMIRRCAILCLLVAMLVACSAPVAGPSTSPTSSVAATAIATPSATASPTASPAASPTAPSESPATAWARVLEVGDGSARTVGSQVTYGDAGFLAITTDWIPTSQPGPGVAEYSMWHSTDGTRWSEVEFPTDDVGIGFRDLHVAADGSYVLHGSRSKADPPYSETFALRSADGRTWEQVATGLPDAISIQAIETGPSGYLLVGGQTADANPTLWLSADGLTWELVHEFQQDTHWVQIHDADGGQEGYVVIGRRIEPDGAYRRFAFASADGREWLSVDEPFGADNQGFVFEANVSSLGPDWVATLGHPEAPTAVWFSANGLEWSEVAFVEHGPNTIAALLEEVDGQLIFSPGSGVWEGTAGVWSSRDGVDWTVEDFGGEAVWLGGAAEGNGVITVAGTVPNEDFTSTGGLWVRPSD
jgi:hypothetical protein